MAVADSFLVINGTQVATPSAFELQYQDVHSSASGRTANGNAIIYVIGTKRKLKVTFPPMTASELSTLMGVIETSGNTFTVSFADATTGASGSGTFYKGDRNVSLAWWDISANGKKMWNNLSTSFIEV